MPKHKVIGLMSGSSLDGLDIAYCYFEKADAGWKFSIEKTECIAYTDHWRSALRDASALDGRGLSKLHADYGRLLSALVNDFISKNDLSGQIDMIASHGHTVFHFPDQHFTTQIGDGAALAAGTGIPVVCDLRSSDIALGGQGAPIVPIGDLFLFKDYSHLLNLGGIANLSIKDKEKITAFDICAANQILDHYASLQGHAYDKDGAMAATGTLCPPLLDALDGLKYYQRLAPKSLDNGFSREVVIPLIDGFNIPVPDKLNTCCEHIAQQINQHILKAGAATDGRLFITGGGAFNKYLVRRIAALSAMPVYIPSDEVVQYKEALIMAFIGLLRWQGEINVLSAVTGASRDSSGGAIYHP